MTISDRPAVYWPFSNWSLSGVCTFTESLIREIRGFQNELHLISRGATRVPLPKDLVVRTFSDLDEYALFLRRSPPAVLANCYSSYPSFIERIQKHRYMQIVQSDDPFFYLPLRLSRKRWHRVVSVSSEISRKLALLGVASEVISNGVPGQNGTIQKPVPRGKLHLLYSGRLEEEQKRVSCLIRISELLRQLDVPFEIRIVGTGSMEERLREYFSPEEMLGYRHPEEMASHYQWAHFLLLPSRFEGESLALLESLSYGCVPVIGDFDSDLAAIIRERGLGFSGEPEGMASYIASFADKAENWHQLSEENRRFFENSHFRIDRAARKYERLFREVWTQPAFEMEEKPFFLYLLRLYSRLLFSRFRSPASKLTLSCLRLR